MSAMGISHKHFAKYRHLQHMVHSKSHHAHHAHNAHHGHHAHGKGGLFKKLEEDELPILGEGLRRHRKHAPLKFRM